MSTSSSDYLGDLRPRLRQQAPFSYLSDPEFEDWYGTAKLIQLKPGQTLISSRQLQERIFLVISGRIRLLVEDEADIKTLDIRGNGQFIGWSSLLRGEASEWVTASEESVVMALSAASYVSFVKSNASFFKWFSCLTQPQESFIVANAALGILSERDPDWRNTVDEQVRHARALSLPPNTELSIQREQLDQYSWYLSTANVPGIPVGTRIFPGQALPEHNKLKLPYRLIGFCTKNEDHSLNQSRLPAPSTPNKFDSIEAPKPVSLQQLGILEGDDLSEDDKYPVITGKGILNEALATCEMISLVQRVPFRRDSIQKILEDQLRRNKSITLELLAGLTEVLGLRTQLGTVDNEFVGSIEAPALMMLEGVPVVIFAINGDSLILGHPRKGLIKTSINELQSQCPEKIRFALPRRIGSTPTSRFGWNWFTPLLLKYRKSLILVFVASLLAQLFGLGIPLLIQQIIDKVLTQGNLSSLNVLGSVMILLAVFQGFLLVLRQYIFVDTTDRMDLTLGSAVIDRLLSLPLSFFEKRPVGELSQRIGELNTIRGFLTGTALASVLNIIFAALYLVVMIVYSPLLTVVALSTLPLYLLLVFGIAPIYRKLIRQRAVAQAKTQSHLIEVLGGIQTVKAQHFERTARWKWQDRYSNFVTEGFKGVVVGTTSGQIGSFLNQLSSLLVLWVGMWLVLKGELTLGMLIAFRIISGNVTSPLLQLSGLYQGFQTVQVSMERISDILDQNAELSTSEDIDQIAMPPIKGEIRFEDVKFRFVSDGPFQVDRVNLKIDAGSFVGIVGQSGSGKSTLTKLLPRLYNPESGRIFIDDYDIGKVNLSSLRRQIGIVPQDSLLFEGTIAENIALNDPQASTESIIEAAKLACAHDFIMSLERGYATKLAERGSNLSGGQRQRIAIARTILSNPQLLVMDEATSALDYNTEKQLCLNLQKWSQGRTVLFITHRLSSIKSSDVILVMHDGKLVEEGSHDELIHNGQRYAALYQQQGE